MMSVFFVHKQILLQKYTYSITYFYKYGMIFAEENGAAMWRLLDTF